MSTRLPPQPLEVIDRDLSLDFSWNGKEFSGLAGDTLASALAANGVRVFSRSFKYHRPRGILTAGFHDPGLFVQVNEEPNVRAGHRLLAPGVAVTAQNAWPSLKYDARAANQLVGRFLSPGFYYKTFMRPRVLRPLYQRTLRKFSSGGSIDPATPIEHREKRFAHPDVVVAGGGPAGMAAALAAAQAGAHVMLVEEEHELGGHLRFSTAASNLGELRSAIAAEQEIEVLTNSVVTGRYDHNWLGIVQRGADHAAETLIKARAKVLVVAAGTIERPYVFEGNDLPGVMLSTAVRRLINLWAVAPGTRAVVVSANESGDAAAADMDRVGLDIAAMVDMRQPGQGIVRARGRGELQAVELADGRTIDADLLVVAAGWTTPTALLNMAGDHPTYDPSAARFLPTSLPEDVMATGGIVGDGSEDELIAHGTAVGTESARRALQKAIAWQAVTPRAEEPTPQEVPSTPMPKLSPAEHVELFLGPTDGFVDFSEDVMAKDLKASAAEGYDSIELNKRYTTATMGPIQGKLEVVNAVAVHADATGRTIADTGTTTWRPPFAPITLGALAGDDEDPVRVSPMQGWHEAHGASPIVAGQWVRPNFYRDPGDEVRNTRENVGIIDVSPLGKIDLRGNDVAQLLEFVYTNKWARLEVGRVRYGVMCAEDGVILDDGVTARLGDDHYYMTTTSSGAGRVWNWLDEWLQTRFKTWDVRMTAITDGYAAINVAGPKSRQLLERLTEGIDLEPDQFGYMSARTGTVAEVDKCVVLRIGFTGELSFEVHVPAGYGLHVWETLLEAGADLGVAPFGLESQRIMRLEKGHFVVGQDTDGLTQGHAAGMSWAIKDDKPDFVGKPELAWEAARGPHRRLVALQPVDPEVLPPEASQIVTGTRTRGRITSSRHSPTLGRSVCLGQVDEELAAPGTVVQIRVPSGDITQARVLEHHAHFDVDGERLRG